MQSRIPFACLIAAAAAAAALAACADLPPVSEGVCGNGVLDPTEQCDMAVDPALGDNLRCGAPGSTVACRYVCGQEPGDPVCPLGWACGDNDACGHADEDFEETEGSPWPIELDGFDLADVDGDRYLDVVGYRADSLEVRFGSSEGSFVSAFSTDIGLRTAPPAVGLINVDQDTTRQRADILFPVEAGIVGFLGQRDRLLGPIVGRQVDLDSGARFVMVRPPRDPSREVALVFQDDALGHGQMVLKTDAGVALGPPTPLADEASIWSIVTPIPHADLDADGYDEIIVPIGGASGMWIYSLRQEGDSDVLVPVHYLTLPGALMHGARLYDITLDGPNDLLVSVGSPERQIGDEDDLCRTTIAEQTIAFENFTIGGIIDPIPVGVDILDQLVSSCCSWRAWPLAMGNLNGPSAPEPDFVGEYAICISFGGILYPSAAGPVPWNEAVIGDFNRDFRADVVAVSPFDLTVEGVDFYFGNDTGVFSYDRIPTGGAPRAVRVGDFDGDFSSDVAVVLDRFDGFIQTEVAVLYGNVQGGPSDPSTVARLGTYDWMDASDLNGDLTSDLVILGAGTDIFMEEGGPISPQSAATKLSFLQGNTQRGMVSPLVLRDPDGKGADAPGLVFLGQFDESNDTITDLVTFGLMRNAATPTGEESSTWRAWLFRGSLQGEYDLANSAQATMETLGAQPGCMTWTSGDLDGDPSTPDVIIGVDQWRDCAARDDQQNLIPSRLLVIEPGDAGGQIVPTLTWLDLGGTHRIAQRVRLADVDGDGDRDVVLVSLGELRWNDTKQTEEFAGRSIAIYRNDGGTISTSDPDEITSFIDDFGGEAFIYDMFDAKPVNADGDPELELAILTQGGVFLADRSDGHYEDEANQIIESDPTDRSVLHVADLNGDGLEDLVFNGYTGLHVFISLPAVSGG